MLPGDFVNTSDTIEVLRRYPVIVRPRPAFLAGLAHRHHGFQRMFARSPASMASDYDMPPSLGTR